MRQEEAIAIANWAGSLGLPTGSVCLNVGSSTADFRRNHQPHIHERMIAPLERNGLRFVHCDMKDAPGVDEIGDILDPEFRAHLAAYQAKLMICSNLLEHLVEREPFLQACSELVEPGGYAIFTVPHSYPYHADPIDTMYRPTPKELAAVLPGWSVVGKELLVSETYWQELGTVRQRFHILTRQLLRVAMPFYRRSQWRNLAHRLLWLFRPYKVSLVLLQKPLPASDAD